MRSLNFGVVVGVGTFSLIDNMMINLPLYLLLASNDVQTWFLKWLSLLGIKIHK